MLYTCAIHVDIFLTLQKQFYSQRNIKKKILKTENKNKIKCFIGCVVVSSLLFKQVKIIGFSFDRVSIENKNETIFFRIQLFNIDNQLVQ